MRKPIPTRKTRPNFTASPVLRQSVRKKKPKKREIPPRVDWVAVGFDTSTYSISGAACGMLHGKLVGPNTISIRWEKGTDYFKRMKEAANSANIIVDLLGSILGAELHQVYIAIEEPVSFGHLQRAQSQSMKQQIQISGAFMGGLLRWGYQNIYEIQANQWRKIIADDLGITTHHTKYGSEEFLALPHHYNILKDSVGKFRSKQWIEQFHPEWDGKWSDLIHHNKLGTIEKPVLSKAKSFQPDDRYDALPIMTWMVNEIERARAE